MFGWEVAEKRTLPGADDEAKTTHKPCIPNERVQERR